MRRLSGCSTSRARGLGARPCCRGLRVLRLGGLAAYAEMLAHVESSTFSTPRVAGLRARLTNEHGASQALTRLGAMVRLAEAQYSPMGHVLLQLLLLWDLQVVVALEQW